VLTFDRIITSLILTLPNGRRPPREVAPLNRDGPQCGHGRDARVHALLAGAIRNPSTPRSRTGRSKILSRFRRHDALGGGRVPAGMGPLGPDSAHGGGGGEDDTAAVPRGADLGPKFGAVVAEECSAPTAPLPNVVNTDPARQGRSAGVDLRRLRTGFLRMASPSAGGPRPEGTPRNRRDEYA
jgi:hypothetical protein